MNVPEKVIFIGNNAKLITRYTKRYQRIFTNRGCNIEFACKAVKTNNLNDIVSALDEIITSEKECVFDLTGGEDLVLAAMGVVCERYKDKKIQMHRFNIRNNTIINCVSDGSSVISETAALSVEENIQLNGGDIAYCSDKQNTTFLWNYDSEFSEDIDLLWKVCRKDVRLWNAQIRVMEAMELFRETVDEPMMTVAKESDVIDYLKRDKAKLIFIKSIFQQLYSYGLIKQFSYEGGQITITYKNDQVKKCLTKAGQVLEMKIYAAAMNLRNKDDSYFYNDVMNGVYIDWDGEIHADGAAYDTENEIDNIFMKGLVPVFVSCKNGFITVDELYKLNTVAERFGGKYAKKVLVSTALEKTGEFGKYFRQRAKDMNIRLVEDVQKMSESELSREVSLWWCC